MNDAYSITFELLPESRVDNKINEPYGYLFRGAVMSWVKQLDAELGHDLHKTDRADAPKVLREYSIQRETFSLGHRGIGGVSGVRFTLNVFRSDMMQTVLKFLMKRKSTSVRLGKQICIITKIEYKEIDLVDFIANAKPVREIGLNFKTPTAFKQMGTSRYCTTPIPEKIFGNLIKQWNRVTDEVHQCPDELYGWIESHVAVTKTKLYHKKWLMGKGNHRFQGFTGFVAMKILVEHEPFQKWIHTLLKFGELSNTGSGRTSGFGRFNVQSEDHE